jgi:hypothetical protein
MFDQQCLAILRNAAFRTHSETAQWRVVGVGLDAKRLLGDKLDDSGISGLDEFRARLHHFTCTPVDLLAADNVRAFYCDSGETTYMSSANLQEMCAVWQSRTGV